MTDQELSVEFFQAEKPTDSYDIYNVHAHEYLNKKGYAIVSGECLNSTISDCDALLPFLEETYVWEGEPGDESFFVFPAQFCKLTQLDIRAYKGLLKAFLDYLFGSLEPYKVYKIDSDHARAICFATDINLGEDPDADNLFLRICCRKIFGIEF